MEKANKTQDPFWILKTADVPNNYKMEPTAIKQIFKRLKLHI